jgi:hypothetical protein
MVKQRTKYRGRAADLLRLADAASNIAHKADLTVLAEAWRSLASACERDEDGEPVEADERRERGRNRGP